MADTKLDWQGTVIGIQPRIRLTRSFDERYHTYRGYILRLQGRIDDQDGGFLIGIGQGRRPNMNSGPATSSAAGRCRLKIPDWR